MTRVSNVSIEGESTEYKIALIMNAGIVVQLMFFICSNKSTLTILAAKFVVSDKGDILSPKKAPETIAPAVSATDASTALAILINATPIVATVVNELPIAVPIRAVMIKTIV